VGSVKEAAAGRTLSGSGSCKKSDLGERLYSRFARIGAAEGAGQFVVVAQRLGAVASRIACFETRGFEGRAAR
jgi:hypothetical protein